MPPKRDPAEPHPASVTPSLEAGDGSGAAVNTNVDPTPPTAASDFDRPDPPAVSSEGDVVPTIAESAECTEEWPPPPPGPPPPAPVSPPPPPVPACEASAHETWPPPAPPMPPPMPPLIAGAVAAKRELQAVQAREMALQVEVARLRTVVTATEEREARRQAELAACNVDIDAWKTLAQSLAMESAELEARPPHDLGQAHAAAAAPGLQSTALAHENGAAFAEVEAAEADAVGGCISYAPNTPRGSADASWPPSTHAWAPAYLPAPGAGIGPPSTHGWAPTYMPSPGVGTAAPHVPYGSSVASTSGDSAGRPRHLRPRLQPHPAAATESAADATLRRIRRGPLPKPQALPQASDFADRQRKPHTATQGSDAAREAPPTNAILTSSGSSSRLGDRRKARPRMALRTSHT